MAFANYPTSIASATTETFNGFRPPYKIADNPTWNPSVLNRDAPNKTGNAAKPCLARSVSIRVQGRETSSATTRLSIWNSDGSGIATSISFNLTDGGSSGIAVTTASLSTPKVLYPGSTYWVGFQKLDTELFMWGVSGSSGLYYEDNTNSGTTSNFKNDGSYASGSLCWQIAYDVLPIAPVAGTITNSSNDITINWTAPSDTGGTPITGYRIQRSVNSEAWVTLVSDTATTATSYTDVGVPFGSTYSYQVAGINQVATLAGADYSGPYSATMTKVLSPSAGNSTSTLSVSVVNNDAEAIEFSNSGSGIPFDGIEIQYGSEQLFNKITAVASASGVLPDPTPQIVQAPVSQDIYGVLGQDVSGLLNASDYDVRLVADNILYQTYLPNLRIQSITINLRKLSEEEIVTLLDLEIDDATQVSFTPRGIGDPIVEVGRIIGIEHSIDKVNHNVTLRMAGSPADTTILTLDSERTGYLADLDGSGGYLLG